MLELLRKGVKSWVAKVLLALLILSFAVWGIGDIFTGGRTSKVAYVGETEVTAQRFADALLRQQRRIVQQRRQAVSLVEMRQAGLDRAALAALIRDAAFAEELSSRGIAVPDIAVIDTIRSNQSFQDSQGNFSPLVYSSALGQQGLNERDYEELTRELLGQQIISDALDGARPAPGFAAAIAAFDGEERTIATMRMDISDAPDPGEPTGGDLQTYFEANNERFRAPERRWGSYVTADLGALIEENMPSDDAVRAEYDSRPEAFTVEPTRQAEQIVFDDAAAAHEAARRIKAGEASFLEIANELNLAPADLPLGTIRRGELAEATEEAIFGLIEPGLAGPIDGTFGTLLLNVTNVVIGGLQPFEAVEEGVRLSLARSAATDAAIARANVIDDIRAGGATMAEIAEQAEMTLVRFQGLAADESVSEGGRPPLAADPRFMTEVRDAIDGEERDIIELSDGSFALVMIDRIAESHIPDLDTIRADVVAAWQTEQRLISLELRATELTRGGADFPTLATQTLAGITPQQPMTRNGIPPILSRALGEVIFEADEGDIVVGRESSDRAVLLVEIRKVAPLPEEQLNEQVEAINEVLQNSVALDQRELFGRALENRHGAFIDGESVDLVFEQLGHSGLMR